MTDGGGGAEGGWLGRLRAGLGLSSAKLAGGIGELFARRKLDDETLGELEDLLIAADLGVATAAKLTRSLARSRFGPGRNGGPGTRRPGRGHGSAA